MKGAIHMEIVKVTNNGRITIPASIRRKLGLNDGDKLVVYEENGRFYLENSNFRAFEQVAKDFAGAAAEAGFETEEQLQEYMREIRMEVRGY